MNNYKITIEYEAFVKAHDKDEAVEKWLGQEWNENNNEFLHKLLDTATATEQKEFGLTKVGNKS